MKLKKWLLTTLSAGCIGAMALGFTACGDGDGDNNGDNTPVLADVNYTLVLTDQDGNAVVGAKLTLLQGETEIATGLTDSDGKLSGVAKEGEYVVYYADLPEGYLADDYTVEIVVSTSDSTIELSADNMIPDGTLAKPFTFIPDGEGYMTISLPASATQYYNVPHPMGRNLIVSGENFEIVYDDDTYTPQDGVVEIVFKSGVSDTNAVELITIINKAGAENELILGMPVPPGSTPDAAIEVALDSNITASVKGNTTVYYTWTATANGMLTAASTSEVGNLYLYNENTYVATNVGKEASLSVSVGDIVLIQISVSETVADTDVNEIVFILTLADGE